MEFEHVSRVGLLEFFQLTLGGDHLHSPALVISRGSWQKGLKSANHREHPPHHVFFLQNGKCDVNVALDVGERSIETF
jgi:hypothetical protein